MDSHRRRERPPSIRSQPRPRTLLIRYPLVGGTLLALAAVGILVWSGQEQVGRWAASLFAAAVAARLGAAMLRSLGSGRWGIDILAITAIASTVVVGEYIAALIIVLMLALGSALEDYAAGRAKAELSSLLERAPRTARRASGSGYEDVPAADLRVDDVLLVRSGEVIPVDGVLLSDSGTFDESSLTGESLPVERSAGDAVMSGSVNGESAVRLRATAALEDSQYSRIIALVREASESRAPMVRLADRYAVPFTLLAYALGAIAWAASGNPSRFAEVLVVATPCPLLIAAPVAFLGGTNRAAASGIMVKHAGVFERLGRIRTAVFDKTGTLTYGRPELLEVRSEPGVSPDELIRLAASAEQYSSHVLALSIMEAASGRGLPLEPGSGATEHATHGVRVAVGGRDIVVGKPSFVAQYTGWVREPVLAHGQLAVFVGIDGRFAGVLMLSDPLRREAVSTLSQLRALGVEDFVMLTGDARATAERIAGEAGLTDVRAECLPADKVEAVRSLPHRPVMMVGDGVNDAPVLAAADVGVAMGARGSTAAGESADVVILQDDLSRAALAVGIGRRTVRVAVQSIWVGIALSIVLMIAAAAGYIPAVGGALSQEAVDLASILNALRAVRPERRPDAARGHGDLDEGSRSGSVARL